MVVARDLAFITYPAVISLLSRMRAAAMFSLLLCNFLVAIVKGQLNPGNELASWLDLNQEI